MRPCFLFVLLFLAAAGSAVGFEPEHLSILAVENDTGYDITALYVSSGGGDYYGPDLLTGGRFIPDGGKESFFLNFEEDERTVRFDLLAVDTEGFQYRAKGFEAAGGRPVTAVLTVRHHLPMPPPLETVDITLKNTTVPIFFVFVRPPESEWWGASALGPEDMLLSKESLILSVPFLGAAVPFEILAVDEDFDEYLVEMIVEPPSAAEPGRPDVSIRLDDLRERQ